jgi:hypothetical protein
MIDGAPKMVEEKELGVSRVINTPFTIVRAGSGPYYLYGGGYWYSARRYRRALVGGRRHLPPEISAVDHAIREAEKGRRALVKSPVPSDVLVSLRTGRIDPVGWRGPIRPTSGYRVALYVQYRRDDPDGHQFPAVLCVALRSLVPSCQYFPVHGPTYRPIACLTILPTYRRALPWKRRWSAWPARPRPGKRCSMPRCPQTAKVDRSTASANVQYDGQPGSTRSRAPTWRTRSIRPVRSSNTGNNYYVVEDGVWFVGPGPQGPWEVATSRPESVSRIPPTVPGVQCPIRVYLRCHTGVCLYGLHTRIPGHLRDGSDGRVRYGFLLFALVCHVFRSEAGHLGFQHALQSLDRLEHGGGIQLRVVSYECLARLPDVLGRRMVGSAGLPAAVPLLAAPGLGPYECVHQCECQPQQLSQRLPQPQGRRLARPAQAPGTFHPSFPSGGRPGFSIGPSTGAGTARGHRAGLRPAPLRGHPTGLRPARLHGRRPAFDRTTARPSGRPSTGGKRHPIYPAIHPARDREQCSSRPGWYGVSAFAGRNLAAEHRERMADDPARFRLICATAAADAQSGQQQQLQPYPDHQPGRRCRHRPSKPALALFLRLPFCACQPAFRGHQDAYAKALMVINCAGILIPRCTDGCEMVSL